MECVGYKEQSQVGVALIECVSYAMKTVHGHVVWIG
jgi:hypothetical protein